MKSVAQTLFLVWGAREFIRSHFRSGNAKNPPKIPGDKIQGHFPRGENSKDQTAKRDSARISVKENPKLNPCWPSEY